MATLQIRIDNMLKKQADALFSSLGLDTSAAIRIFLNASIENEGLPFSVQHKKFLTRSKKQFMAVSFNELFMGLLRMRKMQLHPCLRINLCIKLLI